MHAEGCCVRLVFFLTECICNLILLLHKITVTFCFCILSSCYIYSVILPQPAPSCVHYQLSPVVDMNSAAAISPYSGYIRCECSHCKPPTLPRSGGGRCFCSQKSENPSTPLHQVNVTSLMKCKGKVKYVYVVSPSLSVFFLLMLLFCILLLQ